MSTTFTPDTISELYWAENSGFKRGRDPLGIQNASVTTYSYILPGLTNLTRHIRYYSIFCWLAEVYTARKRSGNPIKISQQNFMRRAELLIATIMYDRKLGAVVGTDFIDRNLLEERDGVIDIEAGADNEGAGKKYWKWAWGAFGQYYLGSLIMLGLIRTKDNWYYSGIDCRIPEAFEQTVDAGYRQRFLEIIESGKFDTNIISPENLREAFGLDRIVGSEWDVLNSLLLSDSAPGYLNRRDTIKFYLDNLSENPEFKIGDLPQVAFQLFASDPIAATPAVRGWAYYYLCDILHYCVETLFWQWLVKLEDEGLIPVDGLITSCSSGVRDYAVAEDDNRDIRSVAEMIKEIADEVGKRRRNPAKAACTALRVMRLIARFIPNGGEVRDIFQQFEHDSGVAGQSGALIAFCDKMVPRGNADLFTMDSLSQLYRKIMGIHTAAAYRKMIPGRSSLLKFIYEEGIVRWVETRQPQMTTPRLSSLESILQDMEYISRDSKRSILPNGLNFLKEYGDTQSL